MIQEDKFMLVEEKIQYVLNFTLNGEEISIAVHPSRRLVDIIRTDLDLTGTKISCEIGRCGACMVLIDGIPHNSCLTMAYQCEGKEIESIEGIGKNKLDPIQQCFLEEGAFQCGYCTPGMIVSLKGLLNQNKSPNYDEIEQSLAGNLCRCTGYGGINRVIKRLSK
ncbi:2Fe-2S iron-sulfur cluster-binding protein [Evansella sp. AB-P1]|uniref:2Fe-2S iron-sulfur cluster-binding protein n=1 Tax=Evansella sp. AB-P1 TaxID=3037653 RepID=UPI00241C492D|nr:2Fe-2S iron-sulfur cluster-binding protein [Evansella sp. AB-P1]MDG5787913.1 2Fe-2S iron-sulfur cluster-binding protein [Evansella sp. AB-P1]